MCTERARGGYVYVIRCTDGSLYCGIAKDYRRRIEEHIQRSDRCAKYMRSHTFASVGAVFSADDFRTCAKIEYRFKKLKKCEKEAVLAGAFMPEFLEGAVRLTVDEINIQLQES